MKALVGAFNQEEALIANRGLLRDYELSDGLFSSSVSGLVPDTIGTPSGE